MVPEALALSQKYKLEKALPGDNMGTVVRSVHSLRGMRCFPAWQEN